LPPPLSPTTDDNDKGGGGDGDDAGYLYKKHGNTEINAEKQGKRKRHGGKQGGFAFTAVAVCECVEEVETIETRAASAAVAAAVATFKSNLHPAYNN